MLENDENTHEQFSYNNSEEINTWNALKEQRIENRIRAL